MFLEGENNSGKLQIIRGKLQNNSTKFQNNAINDTKQISLSHVLTTKSSPLHIANSPTPTGNFCFPSASR